jgi:hypothetical protein
MSLLKKASIITTPTAYAEDYLYSIKPAYALGSELVTNGTFDTDSNWTKGSGWTISGGKANRSGESGNSFISQDINVISGRNYIVKYDRTYVSGDGQTNLFSYFEGNSSRTTRGNYEDTTQETVTVTDYFKPTYTGNLSLRVYGISDFTGSVDNVSIKEITDADFDFDRNSTGTRVNEDYLIEDVPYNLFNYSEQLDNAYWISNGGTRTANQVIAPDGTLTADKFLFNAYASGVYTSAFPAGTYTMSIFIKPDSGDGLIRVGMGLNNSQLNTTNLSITNQGTGVGRISSAANGFYRFVTTFTTTSSTAANIYNLNTNTVIAYMWGAQLVKGDQPKDYLKTTDRLDIPRIDYTNGEPSILLEPSRTNLFEYDIDFSQVHWTKQNVTLQSNNAISPEGLQNASNIYPTTNVAYIYNTTTASSSVYTVSAYVKANGKNVAWLYSNSASTNGTIYFDLSDDSMQVVAGSAGTPTGTINKMPNGWYRITYTTGTAISLTGGSGVGVSDAKGSLNATQNGTDGILVYGLQIEAGSHPTSLIHTSGSAVTRSQDAANNAGNSNLFNDSEGVLYFEAARLSSEDNSSVIFSISDGSNSNAVSMYYYSSGVGVDVFNSLGTKSILHSISLNQQAEFNKLAIKYKSNDLALWINGSEVAINTDAINLSGLNQLMASYGNGQFPFYGNAKMVAVFKEALTDLELEKLTGYNNHELYMNYYNRLSYLGLAEEYNVESDINNYIL